METLGNGRIVLFGEAEDGALEQMRTCMTDGRAYRGVLCGDNHKGYSQWSKDIM